MSDNGIVIPPMGSCPPILSQSKQSISKSANDGSIPIKSL